MQPKKSWHFINNSLIKYNTRHTTVADNKQTNKVPTKKRKRKRKRKRKMKMKMMW